MILHFCNGFAMLIVFSIPGLQAISFARKTVYSLFLAYAKATRRVKKHPLAICQGMCVSKYLVRPKQANRI